MNENGEKLAEYTCPIEAGMERYLFNGLGQRGDYIYACTRQNSGGYNENENNPTLGDFYVFDRNLNLISRTDLKGKGSNIVIYGDIMIVDASLYNFTIFDISNPASPRMLYCKEVDRSKYEDFHGGAIYEHDGRMYFAVGMYGSGLGIYDITDVISSNGEMPPVLVGKFNIGSYAELKVNVHFFDVVVDYPYIYSTVASSVSKFGTESDIRGVISMNIEDVIDKTSKNKPSSISYTIAQLPDEMKAPNNPSTGDTDPTRMIRVGDKLLTNTDSPRIAVFDIGENGRIAYDKCIETNAIPYGLTLDGERLWAASYVSSSKKVWKYNYIYDVIQ